MTDLPYLVDADVDPIVRMPESPPPGAGDYLCANCDQGWEAHVLGGDGTRYSGRFVVCDGWWPVRRPPVFVPDPNDCCKVGHGRWQHGRGCPNPGPCSCHRPRQIHGELTTTPSAWCQWPANGDDGPPCGKPAQYVVESTDQFARAVTDVVCGDDLQDCLEAATVVYPTEPVRLSLVVIDQSCWSLAREAWRGHRRLMRHRARV